MGFTDQDVELSLPGVRATQDLSSPKEPEATHTHESLDYVSSEGKEMLALIRNALIRNGIRSINFNCVAF